MKRTLLIPLVVLVVAGLAAAVGAAVYFLAPQEGAYTGPGIPQTVSGSCALRGDGAWCSQGFVVNGSRFNTTMCFSDNSTPPLTVWTYLMNATQYHEFDVNSTLSHISNVSAPGCLGPVSVVTGPGPFFWVWIDTTTSPIAVQYSVSVTVG